ncbi:MAG TPA: hypothetical protein VK625_17720 [Flavitalea sp.]|nr:hypothetical protein [Flavitalea sp.]
MLIRAIVLFLLLCTACRSGIIPCPDVRGLRLKKSHQVNKRFRLPERNVPRAEDESVITVSSDAKTPQQTSRNSNKYRYVKYTIQHVDVEELDCPKPGEKKTIPRAIKENIRKNRKKIRYYQEASSDSLELIPANQKR